MARVRGQAAGLLMSRLQFLGDPFLCTLDVSRFVSLRGERWATDDDKNDTQTVKTCSLSNPWEKQKVRKIGVFTGGAPFTILPITTVV